MKLCRITHERLSTPWYAKLTEHSVELLAADERGLTQISVNPRSSAAQFDLAEVKVLAPVAPSKIVCVGRNYREHAAELGNKMPDEPLLFLKAPSAIISSGDEIVLPSASQQVEHEGELGVVIGRIARKIASHEDPLSYVLGYTCVNDVTARDLQRKDVQFTRGKSFDTFCPVGPWIETDLDPGNVTVETRLNGELKQKANTADR